MKRVCGFHNVSSRTVTVSVADGRLCFIALSVSLIIACCQSSGIIGCVIKYNLTLAHQGIAFDPFLHACGDRRWAGVEGRAGWGGGGGAVHLQPVNAAMLKM